ncbi:MAG: dockerin type I domain-containing protein [Firmicutes bacterium]|nr:dockerin type I domain-containing protein [Bacillota bacterium]
MFYNKLLMHNETFTSKRCRKTLVGLIVIILFVMLIFSTGIINAAASAIETEQEIHNGLSEIAKRLDYHTSKPFDLYSLLPSDQAGLDSQYYDGFKSQTESLHFMDEAYGTHIWRLTFDPWGNYENRSDGYANMWSADGSMITFYSDRLWQNDLGGAVAATFASTTKSSWQSRFIMSADGGAITKLPYPASIGSSLGAYSSGVNQPVTWDTINPKQFYQIYISDIGGVRKYALYRVNVQNPASPIYTKLVDDLNVYAPTRLNSNTNYQRINKLMSGFTADGRLFIYDGESWSTDFQNPENCLMLFSLQGVLQAEKENDIAVTAIPAYIPGVSYPSSGPAQNPVRIKMVYVLPGTNDVVFGYGMTNLDLNDVVFWAKDGIFDAAHVNFITNYAARNATPQYVKQGEDVLAMYFSPGLPSEFPNWDHYQNNGLQLFSFLNNSLIKSIIPSQNYLAGHCGMFGANNSDIIVAAVSDPINCDTNARVSLPTTSTIYQGTVHGNGIAVPIVNTYSFINRFNVSQYDSSYGGRVDPNNTYPQLSPDGTKVLFQSGMLGKYDLNDPGKNRFTHGTAAQNDLWSAAASQDLYVAVVRPPEAPVNLRYIGNNLIWDAPTHSAEAKGWIVYASLDEGATWKKIHNGVIPKNHCSWPFTEVNVLVGVIMEENCGLQSDRLSNVIKISPNGNYSQTDMIVSAFKNDAPQPIGEPEIIRVVNNVTYDFPNYYNLDIKLPVCFVEIDWSHYSPLDESDIWYYNIYYSNEGPIKAGIDTTTARLIASIPATEEKHYIDWGANNQVSNNFHFYFITAVDHQGNESSVGSRTPLAPTELRQIGATMTSITISWLPSDTTGGFLAPDFYDIYIDGVKKITLSGMLSTCTVNDLNTFTSYDVSIVARRGNIYCSPVSATLTALTLANPELSAPINLYRMSSSLDSISLGWTASSTAEGRPAPEKYEIYRADNICIGRVDATVTSYTVDNLLSYTEYSFYIKAVNETLGIVSDVSNILTTKTLRGPGDHINDPLPPAGRPVRQGLTEIFTRIYRENIKPVPILAGDFSGKPLTEYTNPNININLGLKMQTEALHFMDDQYGTQIWRLSGNGRDGDTFAHNTLSFSPFNEDGSIIGFISSERLPFGGLWSATQYPKYMDTPSQWADTLSVYTIGADGSNMNRLPWQSPEYCRANSTRAMCAVWDRKNPHLQYFAMQTGLYSYDIRTAIYTKVVAYNPENEMKNIYCPPSASGKIIVIDDIGDNYPVCRVHIVDPYAKTVVEAPLALHLNFPPHHDQSKEYSIHGIGFLGGTDDIVWHYGSFANVGETIWYKMAAGYWDTAHVTLWNDGLDSTKPYPGHSTYNLSEIWRSDFMYSLLYDYGGGSFGGVGLNIYDMSKTGYEGFIKKISTVPGGHTAYNSYDPDTIIASCRDNYWGGLLGQGIIMKGNLSGPANNAKPFVNTYGGNQDQAYVANNRPDLSPDGTKITYHSSMLGYDSNNTTDLYVAVVHPPMSPVDIKCDSAGILSWKAPKYAREAKGFYIYYSANNGDSWSKAGSMIEIDPLLEPAAKAGSSYNFDLKGLDLQIGASYCFGIIMQEMCGLAGDSFDEVAYVVFNGSTYITSAGSAGIKDLKTTPPAAVGVPAITAYYKGNMYFGEGGAGREGTYNYPVCYNVIDWSFYEADLDDVWYYNIYYSVSGIPLPIPERRIASVPATDPPTYIDWQCLNSVEETDHFYFVTAVDHHFNESSAVPITDPPAPPTNLRILEPSLSTSINVAWDASSVSEGFPPPMNYRVYVNGSLTLTVDASTTQAVIGDLDPETTYSVSVSAYLWGLESAPCPAIAVTTGADQRLHIMVPKKNEPVALDGHLSSREWVFTKAEKVYWGSSDNKIEFGLLWDNDYLYIGAKVEDNDCPTDNPNWPTYQNDSLSIYLNGDGKRAGAYTSFDYEIEITSDSRVGAMWNASGAQGIALRTSYGFNVELKLPWSKLGIYNPQEEITAFGFDLQNNDRKGAAQRDAIIAWCGDENCYKNTSKFGLATLTGNTQLKGVKVSGIIKSYNPAKPAQIQLIQDGRSLYTIYTATIHDIYGQAEQKFLFPNVAPGTYDLVITKEAHTKFTVKNIEVGEAGLDLTQDPRPAVQLMTLRCGDLNGDGMINNSDLMILWNIANYNKSAAEALNSLGDLNGDGMINNLDLTILWLPYNYNRGEIIVN